MILTSEDSVTLSVYQFSSRRLLFSILFRLGADSAPGGRGGAWLGFDRTLMIGALGPRRECGPFLRRDRVAWRVSSQQSMSLRRTNNPPGITPVSSRIFPGSSESIRATHV